MQSLSFRGGKLDVFSIGAMGYIIVFGTVVPFLMYFNGLKVIGPVKASLISCSEPLCSVLFSVAF